MASLCEQQLNLDIVQIGAIGNKYSRKENSVSKSLMAMLKGSYSEEADSCGKINQDWDIFYRI